MSEDVSSPSCSARCDRARPSNVVVALALLPLLAALTMSIAVDHNSVRPIVAAARSHFDFAVLKLRETAVRSIYEHAAMAVLRVAPILRDQTSAEPIAISAAYSADEESAVVTNTIAATASPALVVLSETSFTQSCKNADAACPFPQLGCDRPLKVAAYQTSLGQTALERLQRYEESAFLMGAMIVGTASTYNPYVPGNDSGGMETASGETYDPSAWTAAIQIDLREQFGGVRYGRKYQPAYALIEGAGKKVIVKINDVGPLKPGRVIDLNERTMRYFDPSMQRGLIPDIRITPLAGDDWTLGPVGGAQFVVAGGFGS